MVERLLMSIGFSGALLASAMAGDVDATPFIQAYGLVGAIKTYCNIPVPPGGERLSPAALDQARIPYMPPEAVRQGRTEQMIDAAMQAAKKQLKGDALACQQAAEFVAKKIADLDKMQAAQALAAQ